MGRDSLCPDDGELRAGSERRKMGFNSAGTVLIPDNACNRLPSSRAKMMLQFGRDSPALDKLGRCRSPPCHHHTTHGRPISPIASDLAMPGWCFFLMTKVTKLNCVALLLAVCQSCQYHFGGRANAMTHGTVIAAAMSKTSIGFASEYIPRLTAEGNRIEVVVAAHLGRCS
jgi:hypothetical protein